MQMHLKVLGGAQDGKLVAVNQEKFVIGRSDECQLRPKSESISRRHCAIVQKDGRILLLDLKSRNGTYVNDKQLDPSKAKVLKNGDKIRVMDIDAPETHPPRCPSESELGNRATKRLQELLNAGPFQMETGGDDTDQYGRKLRVVTRDGESIGGMLVDEGLAREWSGSRQPWC